MVSLIEGEYMGDLFNFIYDPLGDDKSQLQLIGNMGNDLTIVNDAKASFDRQDDEFTEKSKKLVTFLIKNGHTSPLRGCVLRLRVKAPLAVCRQWWKYVVSSNQTEEQLQHNEQSLRYVEVEDEFYYPEQFRQQSKQNKQVGDEPINSAYEGTCKLLYKTTLTNSYTAYKDLLSYGVCREQARLVLPPAIYTTWVNTLSLQSVMHFVSQRLASGSQWEIRQYAICIADMLEELYPVAWGAWKEHILPTYEK